MSDYELISLILSIITLIFVAMNYASKDKKKGGRR